MTTTTTTQKNCNECGEAGARSMRVSFGGGDVIYADLCGTACRDAIIARSNAWKASPEGRIAIARQAGKTACNHCGTTDDVHLMRDQRDGVTGDLCIACGAKVDPEGTWLRVVQPA